LTRRQRQVAGLVSTGETNRDVALRLGISINTVKKYLKLAFAELDIANRTELAAFLGHRCTGSDVVA
jgi:DNA-binding CsgD family transcriptional regulator